MALDSEQIIYGFIDEVNGYLPAIRSGITAYGATADEAALEQAYRHVHTIKGAAAMVGLATLSHVAYTLEETLADVAAGIVALDTQQTDFLDFGVDQIESYLQALGADRDADDAGLRQVTQRYRRLRDLPHDTPLSAPERSAARPPRPPITIDADFLDELNEAFREEATDHLHSMARLLAQLQQQPEADTLTELRRVVHTLKGSAATVGRQQMAAIAHHAEDLLDNLAEAESGMPGPVIDLLFETSDRLEDLLHDEAARPQAVADLLTRLQSAQAADDDIAELEGLSLPPRAVVPPASEAQPAASEAQSARTSETARTPSDVVRVPLERLDELVRLTSEFVITRTSLEQRVNELSRFVNELGGSLERVQRIAARLDSDYYELSLAHENGGNGTRPQVADEFDALEMDRYTELYMLSRELNETAGDIRTVHAELRHLHGDFDAVLLRQGRLTGEVQEKLMRTRMVPLSQIATRLQRTVRVVAQQQEKAVDLQIDGEQIELDKKVLEEIADPLLHLLRNAVDHGIEAAELRQALHKPARGRINVGAYYEGSQIVLQVSDDGAGIDRERLRAAAVSGGFVTEAEAAKMTEERLQQLIFLPGFSTAAAVSDISGRGVGMDVVKAAVTRLKGSISVRSTPNGGATFTIRLPLTLAVMRALLVKTRGHSFALPLANVTQILRLERSMLDRLSDNPVVRVGESILPLVELGALLELDGSRSERTRLPVLIVRVGERQVALAVDEVVEGRDIVVKTLGSHLRRVRGVSGATLLGDGSVILILNEAELLGTATHERAPAVQRNGRVAVTAATGRDVLVVDDSVSVRKVVANMVRNAGWNPLPARDGVEALELIESRSRLPDAILLDIEMPRMNGYELVSTLRANRRTRQIPVLMLTSRAADKHRAKAFELGADDYLVKPYQEDALLAAVRRLFAKADAAAE